uniref:Salivary lipocalin n=1 Tax=Triatoma matogrossensis TaxID=162370 RepID=E2J730_9HEMI
MKMIIAVTFLGILAHAFAEECELMPGAEEFDSDKYFNISVAYVTHSRSGNREDVCRKYQTTNNGNGTSVTVVSADYKNGDGNAQTEVKCINKPKNGNNGQFIVECEVPLGTGSTQTVQMETSVIATDNQNYALLQRCTKTASGIEDDILVLQTNSSSVDPGVTNVFKTINWQIDTWTSRNSVGC